MALARDLSDLPRPAKTSSDGWAPDPDVRFAHLLAERWAADNEAAGPKPRAHSAARFRHSDAGSCARKLALAALDTPPSDPMDMAGTWNTSIGTLLHELWQAELLARYPDADIEPKVQTMDGEGAGHIDGVVTIDGRKVALELKTQGGYGFKAAVGCPPAKHSPQGPSHGHAVQAALNGLAVDADETVIVYLSKEAISVGMARKRGFSELGRVFAEWTLDREQYEPLAAAETERVRGILGLLDRGQLAARKVPELPAGAVVVDPASGRWEVSDESGVTDTGSYALCDYCSYQTMCTSMPSGRCSTDEVPVELGGAA